MFTNKKQNRELINKKNEILNAIRLCLLELEAAECFFQYAADPKLIEVAIFNRQSAITRYEYLLKEAKAANVTLRNRELFDIQAIMMEG